MCSDRDAATLIASMGRCQRVCAWNWSAGALPTQNAKSPRRGSVHKVLIASAGKSSKVGGLSRERHGPGRVPDPPVRNDRDRPLSRIIPPLLRGFFESEFGLSTEFSLLL